MSRLTKEQRQQIKAKLEQRKTELMAEIRDELERSGHEHFADLAGEVTDAGDSSVADMLVDRDIAIISGQVEELTQVERSQRLVDSDLFGGCEECGGGVGFHRLLAVPQATRCMSCQEQHDKQFAHKSAHTI
jgi:RNA polymerase-binding transcription factor DksA